jgi:hypothetical protein
MPRLAEGRDHFIANLAAAWSQRRADRRDEVRRIGPEFSRHGTYRCASRVLCGAPPSRVRRAGDSTAPIRKENGYAIRDAYGDRARVIVADDDVGRWPGPGARAIVPCNRNVRSVNLAHEQHAGHRHTHRFCHQPPFLRIVAQA